MSKLAHSNEYFMNLIEIKNAYDELSESEFFEVMDAASVTPEEIEKALGKSLTNGYMQWIRLNIK